MNRRDAVLALLESRVTLTHVPAAFFIHFDAAYQRGQAAVDRHLEFFQHTGMDIVKVQYEDRFPLRPEIQTPADWGKLPVYGLDFYENQLEILERIIAAAKPDALVIQTLYSSFMQAGTTVGRDVLREHARADSGAVQEGMARITESMLGYVRACIGLGVDGFYASTQGGDTAMFSGSPLFEACVKPYDLELMNEMDRSCPFNILHICDFHSGYDDLSPFFDYPGHVVSTPLEVAGEPTDLRALSGQFARPVMGGLDRHGVLASGPEAAIVEAVDAVLDAAPERFILGADCTLPGDVNWDHIRAAIDAAHRRSARA